MYFSKKKGKKSVEPKNLRHLVGGQISHVGLDLVVGEHGIDFCGITIHLCHILPTRGFDGLDLGTLRCLEVLELHDTAVVVERRTGDARQYQVGTAGRQVLLDGKGLAVAEITAQDLEEGTTHEVLIDLVECLCGKLSEVLFKVVVEEKLEHAVIDKGSVCRNE